MLRKGVCEFRFGVPERKRWHKLLLKFMFKKKCAHEKIMAHFLWWAYEMRTPRGELFKEWGRETQPPSPKIVVGRYSEF